MTFIRTFLRLILALLVTAAVVAGIAYRLNGLYGVAEGIDKPESKGVAEDRRLFDRLLEAGVLKPRPDGGLDRIPADWVLLQKIHPATDQSKAAKALRARRVSLLKALDNSAVGAIVRQQVDLWNQTRRIAAIRDNRPQAEGDFENFWLPYNAAGRPLPPGQEVPETFGFIHGGTLTPGLSDWITVPGSTGSVTWRTKIKVAKPMTLTIQLIGKPIKVPVGARVIAREGEFPWSCPQKTMAYVVRVPVRPAPGGRTLELTAGAGINCSPRISGLAIRLIKDENDQFTVYEMKPIRRSRPGGKFVIRTADGVYLTDEKGSGKPTKEAYDLGLLPIVGTGPGDSFSLGGLLASTKLPREGIEVRLTIESKIQRAVQRAVEWGIGRFGKANRYAGERKSAVVILNANTGAILAAGNWPVVSAGINPWDLAAFSAYYPLRDPSSEIAWEVIDKHNTPGSTFKPVTSLALMTAPDAAFRARAGRIIAGLSPGGFQAETGLSLGASSYEVYPGAKPVPNFGGAALSRYFGRPARRAGLCGVPAPPTDTFGLTQAVQFSLNVFFARMAVMMERPAVEAFVARKAKGGLDNYKLPELNLTRTARWLGIDDQKRLDLAANLPASIGLTRFNGAASDILYAQRARSALAQMVFRKSDTLVKELVLYTVALNGIGQTVSASPLQMAQVPAAVGTGRRIRPYLLSRWGGTTLAPPPTRPLPVDPQSLAVLRAGMKAVVEAGTAAGVFTRLKDKGCRTYGKTGTAEIDAKRGYNTGWFIGWRDPDPKTPGARRFAWACMMSHATGGLRFGGTACAPVVARALKTLEDGGEMKKAGVGKD